MKTDAQLQNDDPELFVVARKGGTEAPFSSDLLHADHEGVYHCAVCNSALFASDSKFDSGTGWASFTDPISKDAVKLIEDNSHGMHRTEVQCANCNSHLGHVFHDGPMGTDGKPKNRYCMNGVCLGLLEA